VLELWFEVHQIKKLGVFGIYAKSRLLKNFILNISKHSKNQSVWSAWWDEWNIR